MLTNLNQYLRSVELVKDNIPNQARFPFNLEVVKALFELEMHPNVTFIVGENGTGKSTIMEAIAVAYGFNPEGGTKNFNFSSFATHSQLHEHLKLVKSHRKPEDGFFFRAESYYNLATQIEELDNGGGGAPIIMSYGGKSLHEQSHGESFFATFVNRFGGKGLYILDEPESALSPLRQMSFITRMHQLVQDDSQFIIATHSPIIMAYPNAHIYEIKDGIHRVAYKDTEHYEITHGFLNAPEKMIQLLTQ